MLSNFGVKSIHMRIASPPVKFPCFYGIDTPTKEALLASKYSIEKTNNDELLYLLFLIIPVSLMIIVCFHYFYRSKKNRIVIPNNDIEMGDNVSVKTDETVISKIKKENPYVEIKKVIEHLIVETEKKSLQ